MGLRGDLDIATGTVVEGWAWDTDRPDAPVSLVVLANGAMLGRCLANRFRRDLLEAQIGDGRHSFVLHLSKRLPGGERHVIEVRREEDGAFVPGSPKIVETSLTFDKAAEDEFARILAAAATDGDFDRRMAFLLDQTERLKSAYGRQRSGLAERETRRQLQWQDRVVSPTSEPAPEFGRPSALVIDDRLPDLARDAGSKAIVSHIQSLPRLGFVVSFAPADMRGDAGALEALGVTCHLKPWVNSVEELLERQRAAYQLVYLHRFSNASGYFFLARKFQPRARVVYGLADLHGLRLAREAAVEQRDDLMRRAEWLKRQEIWFASLARRRRDPLRDREGNPSTSVAGRENLRRSMGCGAESDRRAFCTAYWSWFSRPFQPPAQPRRGPMAHPVDHATGVGDQRFHRLSSHRQRLAGKSEPDGERPDSDHRRGSRPERGVRSHPPDGCADGLRRRDQGQGAGSLAAGVACVCMPVAAEGLDFPPQLARFVGATAPELARAVVALHNDEALNAETAAAGVAFIREYASEDRVDAALARAADLPTNK